jgi:hypothetical protein
MYCRVMSFWGGDWVSPTIDGVSDLANEIARNATSLSVGLCDINGDTSRSDVESERNLGMDY